MLSLFQSEIVPSLIRLTRFENEYLKQVSLPSCLMLTHYVQDDLPQELILPRIVPHDQTVLRAEADWRVDHGRSRRWLCAS
jgi:hypothetical protein